MKVTSVADISVGDQIRLDVDTVGHGTENVTVTRVGTRASRTTLVADARPGATNIKVSAQRPTSPQDDMTRLNGFAVGDKMTVGTPANQEIVTITALGTVGPTQADSRTASIPTATAPISWFSRPPLCRSGRPPAQRISRSPAWQALLPASR
jgi:hypothetical protein